MTIFHVHTSFDYTLYIFLCLHLFSNHLFLYYNRSITFIIHMIHKLFVFLIEHVSLSCFTSLEHQLEESQNIRSWRLSVVSVPGVDWTRTNLKLGSVTSSCLPKCSQSLFGIGVWFVSQCCPLVVAAGNSQCSTVMTVVLFACSGSCYCVYLNVFLLTLVKLFFKGGLMVSLRICFKVQHQKEDTIFLSRSAVNSSTSSENTRTWNSSHTLDKK